MGSLELPADAHFAVPCGLAGMNCPPELGRGLCRLTPEQIERIGDLGVAQHVALCQLEQRKRVESGKVPDPKTGLDSLPLMLAKVRSRFAHPTRSSEQVETPNGRMSTLLVAFVDGDEFRRNNQFGHGFGDTAAKRLADLMREATRPNDFLARWGEKSDEFLALMFGVPREDADKVADRLQERLKRGTLLEAPTGESVHIGASIGTAYIENLQSFREIEWTIDTADRAVMAWKGSDRQGLPERHYLTGGTTVPSQVPHLLV